jgi:hypothetical protein
MIQLLDTALGFVAIMAMLSLLVKSLVSLLKSYVDYYSGNLRAEVDSLVTAMLGRGLDALTSNPRTQWMAEIDWKGLGEDYLRPAKIKLLLQQLNPNRTDKGDLRARLDLHLAKNAFEPAKPAIVKLTSTINLNVM